MQLDDFIDKVAAVVKNDGKVTFVFRPYPIESADMGDMDVQIILEDHNSSLTTVITDIVGEDKPSSVIKNIFPELIRHTLEKQSEEIEARSVS